MRYGFATLKLAFFLFTSTLTFEAATGGQFNSNRIAYELRNHNKAAQHVIHSKNRLMMVARRIEQVNNSI